MSQLSIECADGVGHLVLHRHAALNALDRSFAAEIDSAVQALDADERVRVILISAGLAHFCVGADIREMAGLSADEARATGFIGCVRHVQNATKPLIVAVNGVAAGGGCELVQMCDIVIAADNARFIHPEITLAAMPGTGGTQRLTRVVGKHAAMDMLLTGRALSATEALALGLVSRIAPAADLPSVAGQIASQVASMSGPVTRRIKACVLQSQVGLAEGLAIERSSFQACFDENDFREGLAAFLAKRRPDFRSA